MHVDADGIVGPQLGSDPEIQAPNVVSNHLTTGLLNYIHTTGRYASGINLFEKLRTRDIEVSSLLARVLLSADEEVQAVKLLHDAVSELPMDYSLLDCQSSFCQSKNRLDWALECAKRGVTAAPSEFCTWAKLAEIYVGLEQWDLALLTLNSCPMFTYQDKDAPRMPEPARVILPVLPESILDEIDDASQSYDSELVHPSLRKLHAAGYKGTFLKAYSLLTEITAKIGWDQLLKIRSQVFVMEEEYRSEKQTGTQHTPANQNASTIALHSPSPQVNGASPATEDHDIDGRPSIATTVVSEQSNGAPKSATLAADESIEKPNQTITSEEVKASSEEVSILSPSLNIRLLNTPSRLLRTTQLTPNSTTNAFASAGSTTSSWSFTKTSAYTPFGAQTWPEPSPKKAARAASIENPPRNGKFLASWRSGYTMVLRQWRPIRAA